MTMSKIVITTPARTATMATRLPITIQPKLIINTGEKKSAKLLVSTINFFYELLIYLMCINMMYTSENTQWVVYLASCDTVDNVVNIIVYNNMFV